MNDIKVQTLIASNGKCMMCRKRDAVYEVRIEKSELRTCYPCIVQYAQPPIRFAVAALVEQEMQEGKLRGGEK